jgi:hypothetical protein
MQFDTKIAIVVHGDLATWQKLNVTAFLAAGLAGTNPALIGNAYESADGQRFMPLCIQPILVYAADGPGLARALERALSRGVEPAIYTQEMFATMNDAANRAVVKAVKRVDFQLAGLAVRAERKLADKILDGLKFHP